MTNNKKILITSALPYVNAVPHLGNIIGSVLSADVFARFCRSKGFETRYICGTDEHGTTTEVKALEEGLSPQEICDKYNKIHKEIYNWFNISFDHFGRTSEKVHHKITQDIFLKVRENGFIVEDFLDELYCNTCKKSLADRFVEGTCPKCNYAGARGDQCDKCGNLLNPFELINPKCKVCSSTPEKKSTKHLFLDLEKLQPELEVWIEQASNEGKWSDNTIQYTNAWLRDGLKKRCISRQIKWGIPIPLKEFEDMVFYVWFDAPIGYISITAEKFDDYNDWWKNPDDVKLYQFMGKDNVPFHSILFPGTQIATREEYTKVHHLSTTEFLNYEDSKFSKSRGTGVFGDDAIKTGLHSDAFRYYLLINRPEKSDTVFSWDDFQEKLNSELIANLGNLVNRTLVFLDKFYNSEIPNGKFSFDEEELFSKAAIHHTKITSHLQAVELKDGLKEIMTLCNVGNKYFQDSMPWKTIKEDKDKADATMLALVNFVKDVAIICEPYIPATSKEIFNQLAVKEQSWAHLGELSIINGHKINKPKVLFNKLLDEDKEKFKHDFSGKSENKDPIMKKSGPALLDLRVAKIISAKDHSQADKLMILNLDVGENNVRQIVAGIREHYSKDELIGKKIVIVNNLKPALLRGEESNGMLLACTGSDGTVGLVSVDEPEGSKVAPKGTENNSDIITIDQFASVKLEVKEGATHADGQKLFCNGSQVGVERGVNGKVR